MGKPAARSGDMHICPMITGVVPHVGGPIAGPGVPTVLIGGMPASVMGDMCTCTGPPDLIALGSTGVFIGGKPAARMGDMTSHGGSIIVGCPTVLIGESGGGTGGSAASKTGAGQAKDIANANALSNAAKNGDDTAERKDKNDYSAQFTLVDEADAGMKDVNYEVRTKSSGELLSSGKTDASGKTSMLPGYTTFDCSVTFFNKN